MANPFAQIDKLLAKHKADLNVAEEAVREAKATSLKVLDNGIWRCRFRPYKGEHPLDVRAVSAAELAEQLRVLALERANAKKAAVDARVKQRVAHRELVATTRAKLKELGATRIRARLVNVLGSQRTYRWTCSCRSHVTSFVTDLDEASSSELIAAVRTLRAAERG
ncbi:hypothetical protein [Hyalangium sp.]|uniref:hypothetical protein n=1 Tax=Hyalangium sp. TaxID=2028555 RepID=UPI002D6428EA|nr:hypothetical protein [Hyalangium sp.]HYH96027.1 hypothetical protein [Hyalangium sp.]